MREIIEHMTVHVGLKRPYHITNCILKEDEVLRAEGISICSCSDQYDRKLGNTIARGRAYKALSLRRNYNPIRENLRKELFTPFSNKGLYYPDNGGQ